MKNIIFLISLLIIPFFVWGQSIDTLRGIIKDSIGNPITGANVWIYPRTDSLHSISNDYGLVKFPINFSGSISIKITSLGYQEKRLSITAEKNSFEVVLKESVNLLKEVVIRGEPQSVIVKKDTVEYDVSQFIQTPDDVIQDLLERLPGLQINQDGSISMMGSRVMKIRINGQEFLITDIKTLTSIIPANLINKIQLIDDYGEESRLTERRLGEVQKVINLTTKSKINNFYVGKFIAAKGINNYYSAYGNVFKYNDRQSMMMILSNNNIGSYSGNASNTEAELAFRRQIKKGFSINWGMNFKVNSYDYSSQSESQTTTDEGLLFNNSNSNGNNKNRNISPKFEVLFDLNENNHFKLNMSGTFDRTNNLNLITDLQSGFQRKDLFTSNRAANRSSQINGNIFFSHKFKNPGRALVLNFTVEEGNESNENDIGTALKFYLNNTTSYYDSTLHQLIIGKYNKRNYQARFSYVEPIKEKNSIEIRYNFFDSKSDNNRSTSWMDKNGNFGVVDSLSKKYNFEIVQNQLDLNFLHKKQNFNLLFGGIIRPYLLIGSVKNAGISFFPVFNLFYNSENSFSFNVNIIGDNIFPSFQQLSNLPDYSNLQNPIYGNPNLKAGTRQTMFISFDKVTLKSRLFLRLQGNLIENKIANNIILSEDAYGSSKQETHFVNVNGVYSIDSKIGISNQLKKNNVSWAIDVGSGYAHDVIYYNNIAKYSNNINANSQMSLDYKKGTLNILPSLAYSINRSNYSIYDNRWIIIQNIKIGLRSIIVFQKIFSLDTRLTKSINWGFGSELSPNPLRMDINISKQWLKKKLSTILECYNIFNEQSSFSQGISGNVISVTRPNYLERYFLLKVIFDLKVL